MYPVLLRIGDFTLYSYGVFIVLAFVAGGYAAWRLLGRLGYAQGLALEFALAAALGGFAGARLYWLIEHWDEVGGDLLHHAFTAAGFTWYGGLLGGTAAVAAVALYRRIPPGVTANVLAPSVALGYAVGRIACQLAGDGTYGRPSDLPWAMTYPQGAVPTFVPVQPTPIYETLAMLLVFAVLWRLASAPRPGWYVFGWFLILSGIERFAVEFLRLNAIAAAGLTAPQWFALACAVAGSVALLAVRRPPAKLLST